MSPIIFFYSIEYVFARNVRTHLSLMISQLMKILDYFIKAFFRGAIRRAIATLTIVNYRTALENAQKGNGRCIFTLYESPTRHGDGDNRKPLRNVQSSGIGNKESRPIINSP